MPTGGFTPFKLDETQLDEQAGLGGQAGDYFTFVNGACVPQLAPASGPVDWDGDGEISTAAVSADLNPAEASSRACGEVKNEIQVGHADWGWAPGRSRFTYRFQCMPQLADGPNQANSGQAPREMSLVEAKKHGMLLKQRSVRVSLGDRPGAFGMLATHSPGEARVVIHGTADLDVERIDPTSLRLGRASATSLTIQDEDGNEIADLVATFVESPTGRGARARATRFSARYDDSRLLLGRAEAR